MDLLFFVVAVVTDEDEDDDDDHPCVGPSPRIYVVLNVFHMADIHKGLNVSTYNGMRCTFISMCVSIKDWNLTLILII